MTAAPPRQRVDLMLVERGLARSRSEAEALILAGRVSSGGARVDKPGSKLPCAAPLEVIEGARFVGRGGAKLEGALAEFGVSPAGRRALDVGASTGGFTQVLLQAGALAVVAVDVGRGQLDWTLRNDPRVVVLEGLNARSLTPAHLPFPVSLATVDVSFIGLHRILPAVTGCLEPSGEIVALVKPQFEVGRGRVGRGGIVRDPSLHLEVLTRVAASARAEGLGVVGACPSRLRGAEGNAEFFLHLARAVPGMGEDPLATHLADVVRQAEGLPR